MYLFTQKHHFILLEQYSLKQHKITITLPYFHSTEATVQSRIMLHMTGEVLGKTKSLLLYSNLNNLAPYLECCYRFSFSHLPWPCSNMSKVT